MDAAAAYNVVMVHTVLPSGLCWHHVIAHRKLNLSVSLHLCRPCSHAILPGHRLIILNRARFNDEADYLALIVANRHEFSNDVQMVVNYVPVLMLIVMADWDTIRVADSEVTSDRISLFDGCWESI